jgi:hypothetical protein
VAVLLQRSILYSMAIEGSKETHESNPRRRQSSSSAPVEFNSGDQRWNAHTFYCMHPYSCDLLLNRQDGQRDPACMHRKRSSGPSSNLRSRYGRPSKARKVFYYTTCYLLAFLVALRAIGTRGNFTYYIAILRSKDLS